MKADKSYEKRASELTEGSPKRSESIRDEIETIRHKITDYSFLIQARMCVQLVNFLIKQQKNINLLVDVHGYQIFANGIFNGDPHPGKYHLSVHLVKIFSTLTK